MILRGRTMFAPTKYRVVEGADPYKIKPQVPSTVKTKDLCLSAFSFAHAGAKEKAIKKTTPEGNFALCGARQGRLALDPAASPKGGRKL